ncbi:MAG TPA: Rossmann-like and DUF2520 domain-containing protein [Gemmatimonadaceae bacterium]|nr:Rossmann-like and DUF2520 domain-containing protein [Gemmatimonadaceae bacterium]
MTERVLIIGAGQVGRGLFRAFQAAGGIDVLGLHGRRPSAFTTSSGPLPAVIGNANTVIVAVRDDQIDGVLETLVSERRSGTRGRLASGTVVLHTSGAAEPSSLSTLQDNGLCGGTFHPLVPFANPDRASALLKHAWIGIDGDDQARATSRRLAGHLGARTLDIPAGGKGLYHAAAVMSSNFPVVLASLASELLSKLGIPERSAEQAVHGLMEAAVSNVADIAPDEALTGPVARGDSDTVMRHLAALRSHVEARAVYKRMSLAAIDIAARRGVDPAQLESIRKMLLLR